MGAQRVVEHEETRGERELAARERKREGGEIGKEKAREGRGRESGERVGTRGSGLCFAERGINRGSLAPTDTIGTF